MVQKLNAKALGFSLALVSGIHMLLLGIFANFGIYTGAAERMQEWHMFFSLSATGIMTGIIEAVIISFIFGWLVGYLYNRFV